MITRLEKPNTVQFVNWKLKEPKGLNSFWKWELGSYEIFFLYIPMDEHL